MARLTIPALQVYCRAAEVVVTFKRGTDIYNVAAHELRCFYMSDRSAPLDARIVFKTDKGAAYIDEAELVPLAGEGLFREQQVLKGGALSPNVYKTWGQLSEEVAKHVTDGSFSGDLGLRDLLEGYAVLPRETLENATDLAQDGESLGGALVRLKLIKLEDLVRGAIGPGRHFRPKNHGANDVGRALCNKEKVTPAKLKEALSRQVKEKLPLGQILVEMKAVKPEDLTKIETPAISLPDFDLPGEFLVRSGKITRSEMLHYTLRASKKQTTLVEELVEEQKVTTDDADYAQRVHDIKARYRLEGRHRLGEILIEQGLVTEQELLDRLQYQVDHAAPVGALLVAAKIITPEQLVDALKVQDDRLNDIVRREARKVPKTAAPVAVELPKDQPKEQSRPKKKIRVGEILAVMAVVGVMGSMALYTAGQMGKITAKPDPWESEAIDPLYSFFAADQKNDEGAFFTIEDLEGSKKTDVERASELDPQYAEQVSRLGTTLQKQNTEVDSLLAGDSDLMPTPEPVAVRETAVPPPTFGGQVAPDVTSPPALAALAPLDPARPDPQLILGTPAPPPPPVPIAPPAGVASPGQTAARPPAIRPAPTIAGPAAQPGTRPAAAPSAPAAPNAAARPAPAAPNPAASPAPAAPRPAGPAAPAPVPGGPEVRRVAVAPQAPAKPAPLRAPRVTPKPMAPEKALNLQALSEMAAGSAQKARVLLGEAVALSQKNPVLLFNLGVVDLKLAQYPQASISFNKARQLYEFSVNDLDLKTKPYFQMEQLPDSQRPFKLMKALIRANTLLADTVTYQGKARAGLGESIDAKRFYREAARLYRRNAELHDKLGDLYRRKQDVRNAIAEYALSAKADPRYPDPWKALSLIAVEQKKEDLANRYMAIYRRLSGG